MNVFAIYFTFTGRDPFPSDCKHLARVEKNRALICMQISMYPISASFSAVFFIIIRMGQWLKENYNLHVASTKRLLKGNKFLRSYRFFLSHSLPMWFYVYHQKFIIVCWFLIPKNYLSIAIFIDLTNLLKIILSNWMDFCNNRDFEKTNSHDILENF